MDDEGGRKPSRVAFELLVLGYIAYMIGFVLSLLAFFSAFAAATPRGGSSTKASVYIFSPLYFGVTTILGSQLWYFALDVKSSLNGEGGIPRVRVFRESISQVITLLVLLGYVPILLSLIQGEYREGSLIFIVFSQTGLLFLLATPVYILLFYFLVVRGERKVSKPERNPSMETPDEPKIATTFDEESEEATVRVRHPATADALEIRVNDEVRETIENPKQDDTVTVDAPPEADVSVKSKSSGYGG